MSGIRRRAKPRLAPALRDRLLRPDADLECDERGGANDADDEDNNRGDAKHLPAVAVGFANACKGREFVGAVHANTLIALAVDRRGELHALTRTGSGRDVFVSVARRARRREGARYADASDMSSLWVARAVARAIAQRGRLAPHTTRRACTALRPSRTESACSRRASGTRASRRADRLGCCWPSTEHTSRRSNRHSRCSSGSTCPCMASNR
jgi:hypothetical protein